MSDTAPETTSTPQDTPSPIRMQFEIPGYDILDKIGEGASATVWRARQHSLDRVVAIKVLRHELGTDPEEIDDFLREARAVASIKHPNMIPIYDVGQHQGISYFVMELIDGKTLGQLVRATGPLPEKRALHYARQVAEALEHAWKSRHLIHRDVKSDNILLDHGSQVRLADLGIAGIVSPSGLTDTTAATLVGTPNYISPEQAQGDPNVDMRADMYSLGCVLYELTTGVLPFAGLEADAILTGHITRTIDNPRKINPSLSPSCSELIRRMMMKDPKARYATWHDLIREIRVVEEDKTLPARRQGKSTVSPLVAGRAPGQSSSGVAQAARKAATAQRSKAASPALGVFLKVFVLVGLAALFYRLLNLPPKPQLKLERKPMAAQPGRTDAIASRPASRASVDQQTAIPTQDNRSNRVNATAPTAASTLSSVVTALLSDDTDRARASLQDAVNSGLNEHQATIGTLIDAAEAAPRLVLRGFQARIGQSTQLQIGTRTLNTVVKAVSLNGVTAEFILPNGQTREITFPISKLSGVEQSRWIGPADGPVKAMAKTVLLLKGGNLLEARSMAAETGPAADLLTAEIDQRMKRLTE